MRLRSLAVIAASATATLLAVACTGDDPVLVDTTKDGATPEGSTGLDGSADTSAADALVDAATPDPAWTLALTAKTTINAIVVEPATGDIYAGGSITGAAPELGVTATGAGAEALLFKVEGKSGKVLWAKSYGGDGDEAVLGLALDAGALYVTGTTTGVAINLGGKSVAFPPSSFSSPATQSFIAKVDANAGGVAWAVSPDLSEAPGTAHRSICARMVVGGGVPYVVCAYAGMKFGATSTFAGVRSGNAMGTAVLSLTSLGTITKVVKSLGSTSGLTLPGGFAVAGNLIYVAGVSSSDLVDLATNATLTSLTAGGFIARFATDGSSPLGVGLAAGNATSTVAPAALRMNGNDVVVVGKFQGSPNFSSGPITAAGGTDGFIAAFPATLVQSAYVARFGGDQEDDANDLAIATDGTTWIGGRTFSPIFTFGGTQVPASAGGGFQGFVGKVLAQKTTTAVAYPSSTGTLSVDAVQTDEARKYVVSAGTYKGAATFPAPAGPVTATSAQDQAGFIIRRPY